MRLLKYKNLIIVGFIFIITMCVPPQDKSDADFAKEKTRLDSLRNVRCPRLMSSAAEYYRMSGMLFMLHQRRYISITLSHILK